MLTTKKTRECLLGEYHPAVDSGSKKFSQTKTTAHKRDTFDINPSEMTCVFVCHFKNYIRFLSPSNVYNYSNMNLYGFLKAVLTMVTTNLKRLPSGKPWQIGVGRLLSTI